MRRNLHLRQRRFRAAVCALALSAIGLHAYPQTASGVHQEVHLQSSYDTAERLQSQHQLAPAARQYRAFVASALGEIAVARVAAGEYNRAAKHFDEALKLAPDSPGLELEYAGAALEAGEVSHAQALATQALKGIHNDPKLEADAHAILGRALLKTSQNAAAKQELETSVELDPTFDHGYELAIADLDMGDGKATAKIFAEMQASFGNTALIHLKFGQAYLNSDFQMDAVKQFQEAIAEDGHLSGAHYALAAAYMATAGSSKLKEIEDQLRQEIAVSPQDATAYAALGHLLAGQQKTPAEQEEARRLLERATVLDPESPDGFMYLGQIDADMNKTAEAEAALRRSIELTKDVSRNAYQVQKAHYLLGRLLIQGGQEDAGRKEVEASQALLKEKLQKDRTQLTDYLQQSKGAAKDKGAQLPIQPAQMPQDKEAVQRADELRRQLAPALADSYNNLGAITASQGDSRGAVPFFAQAEVWNPTLPGLDYNWGRAAFAAGDYAAAVGPLGRYVAGHPADDGARAVFGLSQFMVKDYAAARKTLAPLQMKADGGLQLQYAYAKSLIETGEINEGVRRMTALEKTNPNVAEIHRTLGEAYARQKLPGAATELQTAIQLRPEDGEAYAALGRLELSQGDPEGALANLQMASRLEPSNAALQQELAALRVKLQ